MLPTDDVYQRTIRQGDYKVRSVPLIIRVLPLRWSQERRLWCSYMQRCTLRSSFQVATTEGRPVSVVTLQSPRSTFQSSQTRVFHQTVCAQVLSVRQAFI